ncbi:LysR family transcriptional regulator [Vibrio sp. SM6]|uniref:LysR family transcriptional regulator n=1 Tax=Vibrio agarilyticus TaxID=2726741 RepID=A0A7X8TRP6_9VIBR|nr:LysR family transcriptional regulator [Vibrio agarilyticus]NLS13396.1 LysR family transcriptional regulator [Vibrio agarilyticus]
MANYKRVEKLMLFAEVAQTLNFSRAAEQLGISKSYLSEQIKRLESELATPLIVRTTRNVRLTAEGESILAQAEDLKRRVMEMEKSLTQRSEQISGLIRLTAPKMFTEVVLHDLCVAFRTQHPKVEFEILSSYQAFNLTETQVDFAFRATRTPPENMVAHHLFDYHHWLVASPEYLNEKGHPKSWEDLLQHQCLTTLHQKEWPLKSGTVQIQGWLSSNENRLLKESAIAGNGIARLASYFVKQEVEQKDLVSLLPDETSHHYNAVYLVYPQLIYKSAKTNAFIAFVKQYFNPSAEKYSLA